MSAYSRHCLWLLITAPLLAQTETGQITGTVTNGTSRSGVAASILVTSVELGATRTTRSSDKGTYQVPALLPGEYRIEVSAVGFTSPARQVRLGAGERIREDFQLQSGAAASGVAGFNSGKQTQGQAFAEATIRNLPNLDRNVFQFVQLAGNVSDAGLGTRGAGVAINGQREPSTQILLDGVTNKNEFSGAIGQQLPLDAVQELSVATSDFTAEYGRASGGIVNVAGKTGGNRLHGTAYEFNRNSGLTSNSFKENASGVAEPDFNRNQFGYSVGAPVLRNKLFVFSSGEGVLVRGDATNFAWVPTPQLLAQTAANTQNFFQTLGQIRTDARVIGTVSLNDLTAIYGRNPCTGLACATLPTGLPLFNHVAYSAPTYSGGGFPQNTANTYNRADYILSARTQLFARYVFYKEDDPAGVLSSSPYSNYDLGQSQFNNSIALSATHEWSPRWISQSKISFNRLTIEQQGLTSRGVVPSMYANLLAPVNIGNDNIAFPGYNPFSPGGGGAFGGPQNVLEFSHDFSWTKGSHLIRFGGTFDYIRDNRTDASYQSAVDSLSNGGGVGTAVNGLLSGQLTQIVVAVNPQGKLPCTAGSPTAACSLTLPLSAPDFSRSNRYKEGALYVQDYWKLRRGLDVNLGIRWEHFGVQQNKNVSLDSNWYAPGVSSADANLGAYLRNGGLQPANKSAVGQLWNPDWKNFAPRVGLAWDPFGDGRTSFRGGYGIGYERNFGNVTFNVIQNLPNYAVLDVPGAITTNNFGPLAGAGTRALPPAGARIVNPDLKTAYAHMWNASLQHQFGRSIAYSAEYSGSKGVNLYSISYPNQAGFGNFALGDACTGNGDCTSQPNPNYGENVGYRGNQGFSIYHALNNRLVIRNLFLQGLDLTANYTWSHAIDNLSSTFFEAGGSGVAGQFGSRNITTNNGAFDLGLLDPFHAALDRGNADFDIRHRVTVAGNWQLQWGKNKGWIGTMLSGWSLHPVFIARYGEPFSVFDTNAQTLDLSAPRATFNGAVRASRNSYVAAPTPDTFHLFMFPLAQIVSEPNGLTPGAKWPANMSGRNAFRSPGFWNLDLGLYKDTHLTDRFSLQLRAEAFNLLNHANLYIIGTTADVGRSNTVDACYGCTGSSYDRRQLQLGAKLIF